MERVEQGPGEFVAEVGSGQPAVDDVHAVDDVEALLIPPENLRALIIEEPELAEADPASTDPASRCSGRVRCRRSSPDWSGIQS